MIGRIHPISEDGLWSYYWWQWRLLGCLNAFSTFNYPRFPPYQGYEIAPRCIILCSQSVFNDRMHSSHCWGWVAELLLMAVTITRLSKCIFQGLFVINNAWPAPAAATWMEVSIHQIMLIHPFQQHNPFIPPLDVDASTLFDGGEVHRRRIWIYWNDRSIARIMITEPKPHHHYVHVG